MSWIYPLIISTIGFVCTFGFNRHTAIISCSVFLSDAGLGHGCSSRDKTDSQITRGRLMFQPIKIQKCTQLKTGRFITVVQTVNLYFTKLLYTVRFGETKTGESRNENLLLAKGCFQVKLKYLWCSVAVLTTDVAPWWSTRSHCY